ncbi:MAG: hypothetical protein H6937_04285 [Burkholderiales bacterium]|nr:hypothetical protein [Burkholderiales bacterium]MDR4516136.1 hypothetical protein [Nitrosomonas sp.]
MKKIPRKLQNYLKKKNKSILRKIKLESNYLKSIAYRKKRIEKKFIYDTSIQALRKKKKKFQTKFYKKIKFDSKFLPIVIDGHFGLEKNFDEFIKISSSFIDSQSKLILFNLDKCTRIWPTAVTLLCSFKQWTEITAKEGYIPSLSSTEPQDETVNSYLQHCGFYDYVNVEEDVSKNNAIAYDDEIVKIKREKKPSEIKSREDAICRVLEKYSLLTEDQIEIFDCIVLIEAFNNVTEHGHSHKDDGWWTLTQYHKRTGIISLCLADNGIGIKNSLQTGPQGIEIKKEIRSDDDGKYILMALKENISGAIRASIKDAKGKLPFTKRFSKGSRRGNGLNRIVEACLECGIGINLLSQRGYLSINSQGKIMKSGTANSRIFAGTLYHFVIPAKKILEN